MGNTILWVRLLFGWSDPTLANLYSLPGSAHAELAGLVQGMEKQFQVPLFTKKGHLTFAITALNFSTPPLAPNDPMVSANKQTAAESARKRAVYKKQKAAQKNVGGIVGKKTAKMLGKFFA